MALLKREGIVATPASQPAQGEPTLATLDRCPHCKSADIIKEYLGYYCCACQKVFHEPTKLAAPASQPAAGATGNRTAKAAFDVIAQSEVLMQKLTGFVIRTPFSGADASGLDRNTPEFIISTVNRLGCNAGCQHFDECEQRSNRTCVLPYPPARILPCRDAGIYDTMGK